MAGPIVVAYDGSPGARDALALARLLPPGAPLLVVCVHPWRPISSAVGGTAFADRDRAAAERILDEARRALAAVADATFRAVAHALPAVALQELAEETDARLIVVGSTARGGVGRVLPGSTAEQVLRGAPCTVAIPPSGYADRVPARLRVVGVALDGSAEAAAARELAERIAAEVGATLRVVQAAPTDPVPELRRATREVDLLVMGSRGRGPLRRVLLGSVSSAVMQGAACPVAIVPRTAEGRLAA